MKKRILIFALSLVCVLYSTAAFAEVPPKVLLNGQPMLFDVPPAMIDGRMMVPMRTIFEALDVEVKWSGDTQEITSFRDDKMFLRLKINDNVAFLNNNTIKIDAPPRLIGGRTFVPLRFVSEAVGASVAYSQVDNTVTIYTSDSRM